MQQHRVPLQTIEAAKGSIKPLSAVRWMSLLAALIAAAFHAVPRNDFVYFDDDGYVVQNEAVQRGISMNSIQYALTSFDLGNWIPVTWLSYILDVELWGNDASGFHCTNLLLHIVNTALLFLLLGITTGSAGRSWCAALLWGIHPLRVESVAWIAERKDVLSAFFLLLMLHSWIQHYRTRLSVWKFGTMLFFTLGLLSKPMLVTAPILLAILDFWPLSTDRSDLTSLNRTTLRNLFFRELSQKSIMLILSVAIGVITVFAQQSTDALASIETYTIGNRIIQSTAAIGWYVTRFFIPLQLSPYYPLSPQDSHWGYAAIGIFGCAVGVFWGRWRFRNARWVASGMIWFLVSILPVIGLLRVGEQAWADRYTYIPMMGLTWMIVWEACEWIHWLCRTKGVCREASTRLTLLALTAFPLGGLTVVQTEYWHDAVSLWTHALSIDSRNWLAHVHLARQCLRENDSQGAKNHLSVCLQQRPTYRDAYLMLAAMHQHQGDNRTAEKIYQSVLQIYPELNEAIFNLGMIAKQEDRFDEARSLFAGCRRPDFAARVELELGQICAEENEPKAAIEHLNRASEIDPGYEPIYESLAAVHHRLGNPDAAIGCLEVGLNRVPGSIRIGVPLARLLNVHGRREEAIVVLQSLQQDHPHDSGLKTLIDEFKSTQ